MTPRLRPLDPSGKLSLLESVRGLEPDDPTLGTAPAHLRSYQARQELKRAQDVMDSVGARIGQPQSLPGRDRQQKFSIDLKNFRNGIVQNDFHELIPVTAFEQELMKQEQERRARKQA